MTNTSQETLREAIARNKGAILSLPCEGRLRHYKTRFLADAGDGFWIESVQQERRLIDQLIQSNAEVGVAFKSAAVKIVLATPILARQDEFPTFRGASGAALLLRFPDEVKAVQRRSNYRVKIPDGSDLSVRAWKVTEWAYLKDKPGNAMELPLRVRDLSEGGMGLWCPALGPGEPQQLVTGQRLRVLITYGAEEVLLEGRCRHVALNPDDSMRVGVQFRNLQESLEGRQALFKLNTLLGLLSRDEVRRVRLGVGMRT